MVIVCCSYGRYWRSCLIIAVASQQFGGGVEHLLVGIKLGQCSRCSSSMAEFDTWHIVHSLDSCMHIFLMQAARQLYPVLSLKFATTSFLGLPLCAAQILWLSVHFFVAASSLASCLYCVAILRFKRFFSESPCVGVSLVCKVVPFLASLSAISFPSGPTWEGTHWNMTIFSKAWKCLRTCFMSFIFDFC